MRRAIEFAPREPALFNGLGTIFARWKNTTQAESAYRQAIALKPDFAEAYYNLGCALHEWSRTGEAIDCLKKAIAIKPRFTDALTQLGAALNAAGQRDEALVSLDNALATDADNFSAHYYRGLVLFELSRLDDAIAALRRAVSLRPHSHEAQYALGNALNNANRETEAIVAYQLAIEAAPDFTDAHADFNSLAWMMGRKELQFRSFEYARSRIGERTELLVSEAEQRMRFHDATTAETLLRRAIELTPDRAEIQNALGRALVMQGRLSDAELIFKNAIERQPRVIAHYQELAIAQLHNRKHGDALGTIERGLSIAPLDQLALGLLSLTYRELGDPRYAGLASVSSLVRTYELPPPADYSSSEVFNRILSEELDGLHTRRVEPFDQTLRGGTQTMGNLFSRCTPHVELLRQSLTAAIRDYIAMMPDDPAHPFFGRKCKDFLFRGSWSCRLRSSGYHTNHIHPQGWISSVYYVDLPEEVVHARYAQGSLRFGESNLGLGTLDRHTDTVQPAIGKLVLFPSYLWHGTAPFTSNAARLTIAFDVIPNEHSL